MKYEKSVQEKIDKMIDKTTDGEYEKIMNRYSTGGPIERKMKKRIGNKVNKGDKRYDQAQKAYDAIEKVYRKIKKVG